jgi:capsular exopolysaccharide synthesis family protein
MITSAMEGEGKTTVLFNLAATLAQAVHRTLMIDGDLREGGLSKIFCRSAGAGGIGLTNYLTGPTQLDRVIKRTPVKNLDILPAGSRSPMQDLIATLASEYDFILMDSPPIPPVADGLTLSRVAHSVVLVVRSQTTDREMAQDIAGDYFESKPAS